MKSEFERWFATVFLSLPMRGAWIEILPSFVEALGTVSLPMRGAWIEILCLKYIVLFGMSLPMRGAWIEIATLTCICQLCVCRSPCGERGLKLHPSNVNNHHNMSLPMRGAWIEIWTTGKPSMLLMVAPHAGSVD